MDDSAAMGLVMVETAFYMTIGYFTALPGNAGILACRGAGEGARVPRIGCKISTFFSYSNGFAEKTTFVANVK